MGGLAKRRLGTVVSREDFTKILLDAAASFRPADAGTGAKDASAPPQTGTPDPLWADLDDLAKQNLVQMLQANGISDPASTLKNVRAMALELEAKNPTLATDVRQSLALMHEAPSDYVARVNAWYDQTMDRVSERFTKYTHYVTVATAALVVLTVQLDMIAVVDRLSVDDRFRDAMVQSAIADVGAQSSGAPAKPATPTNSPSTTQAQPTFTQPQPAATPAATNSTESPAPALPGGDRATAPTPQPNPASPVVQSTGTTSLSWMRTSTTTNSVAPDLLRFHWATTGSRS